MKKYIVLLLLLIPSLCLGVDAASIMGKSADPSGTNNVGKVNGLTWGTASGNATKVNTVNCAAAAADCLGASPTGCTAREDFEGSSSCGSYGGNYCRYSWTNSYGSGANFHYGTSPMQGSYMVQLNSESLKTSFTSGADTYVAIKFKFEALPAANKTIFSLQNGSGTDCCFIVLKTDGTTTLTSRGESDITGPTLSTGTVYYLKMRGKRISDWSDVCHFWHSTDGTTWTDDGGKTSALLSSNIGTVLIGWTDSSNSYFDDIRVWTSDISY